MLENTSTMVGANGWKKIPSQNELKYHKLLQERALCGFSALRREAALQGFRIKAARTKNPHFITFGTYGVYDDNGRLIFGDRRTGYGLTLDIVKYFLRGRQ